MKQNMENPMLLDNSTGKTVWEKLKKYNESGEMDIVTGYFTIGALAWFAKQTNKVNKYRFILGKIANKDYDQITAMDLLNSEKSIEKVLELKKLSQEAVDFLKQNKVEFKTFEPNFCHAKIYLFKSKEDDAHCYYITGSSNLTEAGIGRNHASNVEFNIYNTGATSSDYNLICAWFENIFEEKALLEKTVTINGKTKKMNFKQYLIEEIKKIFKEYTPKDLYYKILFELFGSQLETTDPDFNRQIGRLENSAIYNALYDFQKKGALSLIRMLQNYNGAILADAVGLGKTWTALAVIKYYQSQGREIILLCPKKLEQNWRQYLKDQGSKFEKDKFEYFIRFHTDMSVNRLETYKDRKDIFFTNEKPKLLIIDESHNLRNDKSERYKFLMNNILQKNEDIKVLLLSATPINNSFRDVRNQFKMLVQGNVDGFREKLEVGNLDYIFRNMQNVFNEWTKKTNPQISDFIKEIHPNFFKLTDALSVARTRKMITNTQATNFYFPKKAKPENYFITPNQIGNFSSFNDLFQHFPPMLSGYQPAFYLKDKEKKDILHDEKMRDRFLIRMMYILMFKRLESSWFSFYSTIEKIREKHQNILDEIIKYEKNKENAVLTNFEKERFFDEKELEDFEDEMKDIEDIETFAIGKREIALKEIADSGNLLKFKEDIKVDLDALKTLQTNLQEFKQEIDKENSTKSKDSKLEKLIEIIMRKQKNSNKKLVIFTGYKDTAEYLFEQLKIRGFKYLAIVNGSYCQIDNSAKQIKFEPILERFAPYTKLYKEKEWEKFSSQKEKDSEKYAEWLEWLKKNKPDEYNKIENPIDILITTDVLSEGQNLQDADMVVNYDIHWNPVRVIQRMGRIDRLGSPNSEIFGVNFFPSKDINDYLKLQKRIEDKMVTMKLIGSEVDPEFTEKLKEKLEHEKFDQRQTARMLEQMQTTFDDIETKHENLGFSDFSLEVFRQDFLAEIGNQENRYKAMPDGIYTGFKADTKSGIVALLKYNNANDRPHDRLYELIYIDENGTNLLENQKEILEMLAKHKDNERFVHDEIDKCNVEIIEKYSNAIKTWLKKSIEPGEKKIEEALQKGEISLSSIDADTEIPKQKFQSEKWSLICWEVINNGP
jgi:ERCC4-related helicase